MANSNQATADAQPHDIDPPMGAGRANRPLESDIFWYHPTDLNPDNMRGERQVNKNRMGVMIGEIDSAGTGLGDFDIGRLHLVLFPPQHGDKMELKFAYNAAYSGHLEGRAWGYDNQGLSVWASGEAEHHPLSANESISIEQLTFKQNADSFMTEDPGVVLLYPAWWKLYEQGGWDAVHAGARRVCMARDGDGAWVLQDSVKMVSRAGYKLTGPMAGWTEV